MHVRRLSGRQGEKEGGREQWGKGECRGVGRESGRRQRRGRRAGCHSYGGAWGGQQAVVTGGEDRHFPRGHRQREHNYTRPVQGHGQHITPATQRRVASGAPQAPQQHSAQIIVARIESAQPPRLYLHYYFVWKTHLFVAQHDSGIKHWVYLGFSDSTTGVQDQLL